VTRALVVRHFRQIVVWPLQLMPLRPGQQVQRHWEALAAIKSDKSIPIKRQIQYRLAQLQALSANDAVDLQLQAIEAFDRFRKENANAWETIPAAREEVRMLVALNKLDDAAKVLDELSTTPNLAKTIKQDLDFLLIDVMIRAGKLNEVEGRISQALALLPPNDPLAGRLRIYQLGAQAAKGGVDAVIPQLKTMIDKASDSALKALAYNTLGDCYNAQNKKKEAMWAYLWVDVVYNQDKSEHLKALERLVRVFKDLGDDAHADKYRDKLKSLR
jgi:tetratricopeptide (TPR) repeat protein